MQTLIRHALIGAFLLSATMPAAAATHLIDFSDRPDGNLGTTQISYPGVATFTGTGNLFVNGAGVGKDLCTLGTLGCNGKLSVSFAGTVSNLRFTSVGDNITGSSIFITLGFSGAPGVTVARTLDGNTWQKDLHDLSAYSGITSLTLDSNDLYGLAYDDFSFDLSGNGGGTPGGVPEPASWALMILGFGLAGAALRQRRAAIA